MEIKITMEDETMKRGQFRQERAMRKSSIPTLLFIIAAVILLSFAYPAEAKADEEITLTSGTYNVSELDSKKSITVEDADVTLVIDEDKSLLALDSEYDFNRMYINNSKVTLKGDKTLKIGTINTNKPIWGGTNSELTIESGNVEIYDDGAAPLFDGTVFNMKGGTLTVYTENHGISAKTINISGGTVNSALACGAWGSTTVNITGGTVNAVGREWGIGQDYRGGKNGSVTLYSQMTLNISGGNIYAEATHSNTWYNDYDYLYSAVSVGSLNMTGGRLEAKVDNNHQVAILAVNGISINDTSITEPSDGEVKSCSISYRNHSFTGYTIASGSDNAKHVIIEGSAQSEPTVTEPPVTAYPLFVGKTQVTDANKDDILNDGGRAKYDPATSTLTLNHPVIEKPYSNKGAIFAKGIDLTITGSIELTVPDFKETFIYILDGNLVLDRANITAKTNYATIFMPNAEKNDKGQLTINGGKIDITCLDSRAIYCNGNMTISNAELNVTARLEGIWSVGKMAFSDSTVTVACSDESYRGIFSSGSDGITISGGTVTTRNGKYGIDAASLEIKSGTVIAQGQKTTSGIGIYCDTLIIANGIASVTAEGGSAAIYTESNGIKLGNKLDDQGA